MDGYASKVVQVGQLGNKIDQSVQISNTANTDDHVAIVDVTMLAHWSTNVYTRSLIALVLAATVIFLFSVGAHWLFYINNCRR